MKYIFSFIFILIASLVSIAQINSDYKEIDALVKTNAMIDALDAASLLKKNHQKDTADSEYWLRYSQVNTVLYKYEDARFAINKAIRLEPKPNYYFEKGLLFNRINLLDTALAALETAVALKEEGEYYYWKGIVNQQMGNGQAALQDYRAALTHKFETAEMQNNLSILLIESKKFEEALSHINKAILLDNNYAQAYGTKAKIQLCLFQVDSACSANATAFALGFRKIMNIPDSVCKGSFIQQTQYVADVCAGNGYYERAIVGYSKLIDKQVLKSDYFLNRGYCYYQLKEYSKADADYLKALTLPQVSFDMVYNNLSLLYFDQMNYTKSAEYATKRIELNPLNYVAYLDRGLAYRKMGSFKEAEKDYEKSISLKPDFFRAYAYKAFLYLLQNKFEKALELSSTAIQLNPKYGYAYLVRAQVKQKLDISDFCLDYYAAKTYQEADATEAIRLYCK